MNRFCAVRSFSPQKTRSLYQFPTSAPKVKQPKKFFVVAAAISSSPAQKPGQNQLPSAPPRPARCACRGWAWEPATARRSPPEPVQRHLRRHIPQRLRLGIGQIARKRDQKAQLQRPPRLLPSAAKAVHHAAQPGRPPVLLQNLEKIVPRVRRAVLRPAMDQDGPLPRRRNLQLANQPRAAARRAARPRGSSPARSPRRQSPPAPPAGHPAWPEPSRRSPACCADKRPRWRRASEPRLPVELAANPAPGASQPPARQCRWPAPRPRPPPTRGAASPRGRPRSARCPGGREGIDQQNSQASGEQLAATQVAAGGYFSRAPSGTSSRNPASTGAPSGQRSGQQHPVRLQAPHLARSQIGHNHNLPPDQLFRLVVLRNPGQNLPLLVAQIDLQPQQLVSLGHPLGHQNLRHAQIHLDEVVDAVCAAAPAVRQPLAVGQRLLRSQSGGAGACSGKPGAVERSNRSSRCCRLL
jgi:hypothetical protein